METWIYILTVFYVLLELLYLISCIVVMMRVSNYLKHSQNENKMLPKATFLFLGFCIVGVIAHNKVVFVELGQTPFISFIIAEIIYLWYMMKTSLKSESLKKVFTASFAILLLYLPFLAVQEYKETLYDPLFAIESLLASSISFAYFIQLGNDIKIKRVLEDKITIIMLGLFFCYSLPFAYNTTISAINMMNPELFSSIRDSQFDRFLLVTISRVGTVCYIILNIFFFKAFRWKTQTQTGT